MPPFLSLPSSTYHRSHLPLPLYLPSSIPTPVLQNFRNHSLLTSRTQKHIDRPPRTPPPLRALHGSPRAIHRSEEPQAGLTCQGAGAGEEERAYVEVEGVRCFPSSLIGFVCFSLICFALLSFSISFDFLSVFFVWVGIGVEVAAGLLAVYPSCHPISISVCHLPNADPLLSFPYCHRFFYAVHDTVRWKESRKSSKRRERRRRRRRRRSSRRWRRRWGIMSTWCVSLSRSLGAGCFLLTPYTPSHLKPLRTLPHLLYQPKLPAAPRIPNSKPLKTNSPNKPNPSPTSSKT